MEFANIVVERGKEFGLEVQIDHIENPRVDAEEHYYNATHTRFLDLGLEPHFLSDEVLQPLIKIAINYIDRVDKRLIAPTVDWRKMLNIVREDGDSSSLQTI